MTFVGKLYPFQTTATCRMVDQKKLLVAYEMGLGKTPITIAAVEELIDNNEVEAGFVICPNSLKYQWQRMIDQFTGGEANVIVAHGTPEQRQRQYQDYNRRKAEYLIINPDQLVNDWEIIRRLPRDFIVADEIQWAKNFRPKRSKRLKRLHAEYQWGLTGQPIENRAEELFSIMQWINPEVLGDYEMFDRAFVIRNHWGAAKAYRNLPTLHKLVSEHMVRRTREEVKDQLPAVTEESIIIDFDPDSYRAYRRIAHALMTDLEDAIGQMGNFNLWGFYHGEEDSGALRGRIMSKLMCMRMLCDHPELLRISADWYRQANQEITWGSERAYRGSRMGSAYAAALEEDGQLKRLTKTPKLDATIDLVTEILEANPRNKIVLFSYFKDMLRILESQTAPLTKSVQFTGDMSAEQRDQAKETFATDPECRLFLSSDAGGVGLDLPMANYLISYDLPWSAGAYAQRQSRIIRLSTAFPQVTLISMLMSESIEERQYDMLAQKARIGAAVIDGKGINAKGRLNLDLESLRDFLQR